MSVIFIGKDGAKLYEKDVYNDDIKNILKSIYKKHPTVDKTEDGRNEHLTMNTNEQKTEFINELNKTDIIKNVILDEFKNVQKHYEKLKTSQS
jgi:hypothetical protein